MIFITPVMGGNTGVKWMVSADVQNGTDKDIEERLIVRECVVN